MLVEARVQAELLYSLRAIMRHMTWIHRRFRLLLLLTLVLSLFLSLSLSKFNQAKGKKKERKQDLPLIYFLDPVRNADAIPFFLRGFSLYFSNSVDRGGRGEGGATPTTKFVNNNRASTERSCSPTPIFLFLILKFLSSFFEFTRFTKQTLKTAQQTNKKKKKIIIPKMFLWIGREQRVIIIF